MDWHRWHDGYGPGGGLLARLALVQDQLSQVIIEAPPGPIMIISVCAGQGHDVVATVAESPRRTEVRARLVEADERNVVAAGAGSRRPASAESRWCTAMPARPIPIWVRRRPGSSCCAASSAA
ncbi:hypothetical protein [Microlunatus sp. GCM10028923]|uniref:hypothetical protein n=1 Tax=Microlunatus sp. GCM10028923 TaxID=3273400 RepID=UPI0036066AB5